MFGTVAVRNMIDISQSWGIRHIFSALSHCRVLFRGLNVALLFFPFPSLPRRCQELKKRHELYAADGDSFLGHVDPRYHLFHCGICLLTLRITQHVSFLAQFHKDVMGSGTFGAPYKLTAEAVVLVAMFLVAAASTVPAPIVVSPSQYWLVVFVFGKTQLSLNPGKGMMGHGHPLLFKLEHLHKMFEFSYLLQEPNHGLSCPKGVVAMPQAPALTREGKPSA